MRSLLNKDPIYLCLCDVDNLCTTTNPTYLWFTLRRTTTTEYELVPVSFPCRFFMLSSSTVAMESEIYFIGGYPKLRQGPIMQESRFVSRSAVGLIDGKIYVMQKVGNGVIHEEVFDLESQAWKVAGTPVPEEKLDSTPMMKSCVTLEGKVYAMDNGSITVDNLREQGGIRKEKKMEMPIDDDWVWCICVAQDLLFAFFTKCGLMWLDTKLNVWRVVSGDVQTLRSELYGSAMAEYYGKLALFWIESDSDTTTSTKKKQEKIWCALVALDRVEGVCGTIEWSGVVAIIPYPYDCHFLHCLVASD